MQGGRVTHLNFLTLMDAGRPRWGERSHICPTIHTHAVPVPAGKRTTAVGSEDPARVPRGAI